MRGAEASGFSTASVERRHANILPLRLMLKYQQQLLTAMAALVFFVLSIPYLLLNVLLSFAPNDNPHFGPLLAGHPILAVALTVGSVLILIAIFKWLPMRISVPLWLVLYTPLLGLVGVFWLWIERLVNRLGKVGGVIGLVIGLISLFAGLGGGLVGMGSVMQVADHIGETSPVTEVAIAALNLPLILLPLLTSWALLRAAVTIFRLTPGERALMRDTDAGVSEASTVLSRMWGMPPTYSYALRPRRRFVAILLFSVLSAFFFALATVLAIIGPSQLFRSFDSAQRVCGYFDWHEPAKAAACLQSQVGLFLLGPFGLLAIIGLFAIIALGFRRLAQRRVRVSLEDLQGTDPRPPILFLRAFGDDQVPLRPSKIPWIARLMEIGRRRTNLDEMLLEETTPYGPYVGIGNPKDKRPPYGAARGYFNDHTWQSAVADLAGRSAAVIMCLDDTDGIWWEVEHLVASRHHLKTLFLVHPKHATLEASAAFLGKVTRVLRLSEATTAYMLALPKAEKKKPPAIVIGFYADAGGTLRLIRSPTRAHFAYLFAVRLFLREKLGNKATPLPEAA